MPRYDIRVFKRVFSKTYNEVPDGFEIQKNVTVTYHAPTDLNMIVAAAAQAEIYDFVQLHLRIKTLTQRHEKR